MKIDITKLRRSGIFQKELEFEYNLPAELLTLPLTEFDKLSVVNAVLEIYNAETVVFGSVFYTIGGSCSKCLDKAAYKSVAEFECVYSDMPSKDADYSLNAGIMDLSMPVHEAILFNLPFTVLCKDNCKGLCGKCGTNLNILECDCEK